MALWTDSFRKRLVLRHSLCGNILDWFTEEKEDLDVCGMEFNKVEGVIIGGTDLISSLWATRMNELRFYPKCDKKETICTY
jgi:hypothetical protein